MLKLCYRGRHFLTYIFTFYAASKLTTDNQISRIIGSHQEFALSPRMHALARMRALTKIRAIWLLGGNLDVECLHPYLLHRTEREPFFSKIVDTPSKSDKKRIAVDKVVNSINFPLFLFWIKTIIYLFLFKNWKTLIIY